MKSLQSQPIPTLRGIRTHALTVAVGNRLLASDGRGNPIVLAVMTIRREGDVLVFGTADGSESFVDADEFVEVFS